MNTFLANPKGYPVLSKTHQALITRYMSLKQSPWLLLCDIGAIPGLDDPTFMASTADGFLSPSAIAEALSATSPSPTPAEASEQADPRQNRVKFKDPVPHLSYIRHLQRNQPPRTILERFGSGYQDYLQAPLQPLTDNLESVTYEVFEKDPVKYDNYELAIAQALADWSSEKKPTSSKSGAVVVAVTGAGRGPLVTRVLRASKTTGVAVEVWAVEKNPNAYVLLQRHNEEDWDRAVTIVKSDMRAWKGPHYYGEPSQSQGNVMHPHKQEVTYGKVDIVVSELLGSFADNELSPECLDGVQHVLSGQGISIPSSYTAHLTPILAPKIHADISHRAVTDPTATETPYVVLLHAIDFLCTLPPTATSHYIFPSHAPPNIQQAWEFVHPLPPSTLAVAEARRGGGVSGGGGGSMAGGDGANEHNVRFSKLKFEAKERGVVHGLAGYFEAVLYAGSKGIVELSTRPDTIGDKSRDMISWFPIFFPLKVRLSSDTPHRLYLERFRQRTHTILPSLLTTSSRLHFTTQMMLFSKPASGDRPTIERCGTNGSWKPLL